MGRTADIDLSFESSIRAGDAIERLLAAGWVALYKGTASYMVADFEWLTTADQDLSPVKRALEGALDQGEVAGIALFWSDTENGGNFLIHPERETASFVPELNRRELAGAPEFTDMGWYLQRLVPPLREIGLVAVTTNDRP